LMRRGEPHQRGRVFRETEQVCLAGAVGATEAGDRDSVWFFLGELLRPHLPFRSALSLSCRTPAAPPGDPGLSKSLQMPDCDDAARLPRFESPSLAQRLIVITPRGSDQSI
jgi:hypothetical protein